MPSDDKIVTNLTLTTPTRGVSPGNYSSILISDYTWTLRYDASGAKLTASDVPVLKLHAYQPKRKFYPEIAGLAEAANRVINAASAATAAAGLGQTQTQPVNLALIAAYVSTGISFDKAVELAGRGAYNALYGSSANTGALDSGYAFVEDMFSESVDLGLTYELPFMSNRFVETAGSGGWEDRGLSNVTDAAKNVSKMVLDRFGFNAPLQPTWSSTSVKSNDDMAIEFFLVNDSDIHLDANLSFMFSFLPNCYWAQLGTMQQPPNIFRAEVPGRFTWRWAAATASVEYAGRVRKYGDSLVPDMYKLSVSLKNLCPNNLNTFGASFGAVKGTGQTAEQSLVGQYSNVVSSMKAAVTTAAAGVGKNYLGNFFNGTLDK